MSKYSLLVVDDEDGVHKIFKAIFRKEVKKNILDIYYFFNGKECLDFLENEEHQKKVFLILSDINMPVMDGFALLEIVKKKFPVIEIYMITAYESKDYINRIEQLGADKFFAKPLDFKKLKNEMVETFSIFNEEPPT